MSPADLVVSVYIAHLHLPDLHHHPHHHHHQVENHQTVPVKVYYMNSGGNELHCVGVAEPHGVLALPLAAVYSNTAEIFFGVEG